MSEQPPERPPEEPLAPEVPVEPTQPAEPAEPAEPPPAQPAVEPSRRHPIRLVIEDDLKRSRLTVFFRPLLAIPHAIWVTLWKYAIYVVAFINWWVTLFGGRTPEDLHLFISRYVRYQAHLSAYLSFLGNPYPTFFGREGTYPIDVEIDARQRQRRLITLFRLILGIPAFLLAYVFGIVTAVVAIIGWFVCLILGRMPKGMRDLLAYCRRYRSQTDGYVYLLTDRYPSLAAPPPPS
ncbi:MAG TPA: DUF4389 domain-containing protein [Gaiellaceae bacterium]|nr:DUF4389 domain-containing protein [Gaiellaceae bacterium]